MSSLPTALAAALETAINQVLKLDPDSLGRLQTLRGKIISIELTGINVRLYLVPDAQGLNIYSRYDTEPDTLLRGSPLSMARMGLSPRAGDALFAGDVEISGDVELGQQFRQFLDQLDIDWEEHLSHVTGDMVAHKLGDILRGAMHWGKHTADTFTRNAGEYLQEESRAVPTRGEVEDFIADVDELRADVDRTEARLKLLLKQQHKKNNNEASA